MFMFSFFAFWGHVFTSVCSKVSALFVTEEAISSLHFFCLSPLSKISQSHMGRSTSRLFIY